MNPNEVIIEQSPNDKRQYKYLKLGNQLQVVLCSDDTTEQASASLSVNVGSLSNPEDLLGLAHFLEHMLFLGTEKYPIEKEFIQFISQNGGSYNGTTTSNNTSYFFKVNHGSLEAALDRFSSFFISPLFNADATDREVNAVNSEHKNNLLNDMWRQNHTVCSQFEHAYGRFSTGSLDTLKGSHLRERVVEFYNTYYSSNQMNLAIVGRDSIEVLEQWARKYFDDIPNRSIPTPEFPTLTLRQSIKLSIVPIKNSDVLTIYWPVTKPDLCYSSIYANDLGSVIRHVLGHESRGSLFALLKEKNYAFNLVCGNRPSASTVELYYLRITLTEEGLQHIDDIVAYVYQAIDQLGDIPQYTFNEKKADQDIQWESLEKRNAMEYAYALTTTLALIPDPKHVIKSPFLLEKFDIEKIKEIKSMLTMNNMMLVISSKTFQDKTDFIDRHYGVEYSKANLTHSDFERWRSIPKDERIYVPKENPYIPKDFSIKNKQTLEVVSPIEIYNQNGMTVDYAPDHQYNTPTAVVKMQINTPYIGSCLNNVSTYLFKKSIKEVLNEDILYYALTAGLYPKFHLLTSGYEFSFRGFSDTLIKVVIEIFKRLANFDISERSFERIKELVGIKYANQPFNTPYLVAIREASLFQGNQSYDVETKLNTLDGIKREDFIQHVRKFIRTAHLNMLIYGNYTRDEALALPNGLGQAMERVPASIVDIMSGRRVCFDTDIETQRRVSFVDPQQQNSVVVYHIQIGQLTIENSGRTSLLNLILHEAVFSELRTKQQLGYIVVTSPDYQLNAASIRVLVQSNEKDPLFVRDRIVDYLQVFYDDVLDKMTDDEFQTYVKAIKNLTVEKCSNLKSQSDRFWDLFTFKDYDRKSKMVEYYSSLTLTQLKEYYKKYLIVNRCAFATLMFGGQHSIPQTISTTKPNSIRLVDNYQHYRLSQPLYPAKLLQQLK